MIDRTLPLSLVVFLTVLLLGCGGENKPPADARPAGENKTAADAKAKGADKNKPAPVSDEALIRDCLDGWLKDLKAGNSGEKFWDDSDSIKKFAAVRTWEIQQVKLVGKAYDDDKRRIQNSATAQVRINYSNEGGTEVTKDWSLLLLKVDNRWRISRARVL